MTSADQDPVLDRAARHAADLDLCARCISGDRDAWHELLVRNERRLRSAVAAVYRTRGRRVVDPELEDIVADIVVDLVRDDFRRLRQYRGRCSFSRWLKVVAMNHTVDHLRRRRPTVSLSPGTPSGDWLASELRSDEPSPAEVLTLREQQQTLRRLYERLSTADRTFARLYFVEGRTFEEVATAMSTTVDAIYARKSRVVRKLSRMAENGAREA